MGQRMPEIEIEYGDNCLACFPSGETPKYVYARFSLMEKCTGPGFGNCHTPPNDRMFKLTQHVSIPCAWTLTTGVWTIGYRAWNVANNKSRLYLYDDFSQYYFTQYEPSCQAEGFVYVSVLTCTPGLECTLGGIGVVTWTPQATALLESINMKKARDLFMELRPLANGKLVYKFCRLQDVTNISILFEP